MPVSPYSFLVFAGIAVTLAFWARLAKRDERLLLIYLAALVSAFIGAKVVYLAAEGWMFWDAPDRWVIWATGKTILGALLGGYAGVELAKKALGYTQTTGDWFALIAPVGIVLGRIGCLLHGCCLGVECAASWWTLTDARGVARWPAVPVEILFNGAAILVFIGLRKARLLAGQHFHLYLIGYGAFRFAHEFLRATPRVGGTFSGYQIAALAVAGLGVAGFLRRKGKGVSAAVRSGERTRPECWSSRPDSTDFPAIVISENCARPKVRSGGTPKPALGTSALPGADECASFLPGTRTKEPAPLNTEYRSPPTSP